jgi:hypothetical protein
MTTRRHPRILPIVTPQTRIEGGLLERREQQTLSDHSR